MAILGVLLACVPARAADDSGMTVLGARLGYSGVALIERWTPLTVTIQGGSTPQMALVEVSYPQDVTQNAKILRAIATTPGKQINCTLFVALPRSMRDYGSVINITISALTDRGPKTVKSLELKPQSAGSVLTESLPENPTIDIGSTIVLGSLASDRILATFPPKLHEVLKLGANSDFHIRTPVLAIAEMPTSPLGFDMFRLFALRADQLASLESAQIAALRAWVESGGSLVIICTKPGNDLVRFFPASMAIPTVEDVSTPSAPAAAVLRRIAAATDANVPLASELTHRPLLITEAARKAGWRGIGALGPRAALKGGTSLIARGPLGFGQVVLIGFEPSTALSTISDGALSQLWSRLLTDPEAPRFLNYAGSYGDRVYGSGYDRATSAAIYGGIDSLCDVPPLPIWCVYLVAGAGLVLALLLGPFDFFLLGRFKLRHRSWISAILWLALATGAALYFPTAIRTATGSSSRLEVVDVLQDGPRPVALRAGLTTIFSDLSGLQRLGGLEPQAVVRGVAASREQGRRSYVIPGSNFLQDSTGSTLPIDGKLDLRRWTLRSLLDWSVDTQPPKITLEQLDGAIRVRVGNLPDAAGIAGGLLILPTGSAKLVVDPQEPRVLISKHPPTPRTRHDYLVLMGEFGKINRGGISYDRNTPTEPQTLDLLSFSRMNDSEDLGDGEEEYRVVPLPPADDQPSAEPDTSTPDQADPPSARLRPPPTPKGRPGQPGSREDPSRPAREQLTAIPDNLMNLPGPARRTPAFASRDRSGHFATLLLDVYDLPVNVAVEGASKASRRAIYRICIPLPDTTPAATSTGSSPATKEPAR